MFHIYLITNKLNGKIYIGLTTKGMERWEKHKTIAKGGKEKFKAEYQYVHKAINKNGVDNFSFDLIEEHFTLENLKNAEIFWISYFKSIGAQLYNLTRGGDGCVGLEFSEERKISQCILNRKQCLEIQQLYIDGSIYADLSKRYDVNNAIIHNVILGKYAAIKGYSIISKEKLEDIKKYRLKSRSFKLRKFLPEQEKIIGKIYESDLSLSLVDIANMYNTNTITLSKIFKRNNIVIRGKPVDRLLHQPNRIRFKQDGSVLTANEVLEIRQKYNTGLYTQRELEKEYLLGYKVIKNIIKRISWKHI